MAPPRHTDAQPKEIVQARIDPDALAKLDAIAFIDNRSRSELINFAVRAYVEANAHKLPKTPRAKNAK